MRKLLFALLFACLLLPALANAWWDTSFSNRMTLNVSVTSGTTPANYTSPINVTWATGMQADFDDLRFRNASDNANLSYWLESKVNSAWAYVWVKVDQNITTTNQSLYMYYGKASASSESNVTATFVRVIDGVAGAWRFNENTGTTAFDYSPFGNNGTLVGGVAWNSTAAYQKFGDSSTSYDNNDDRIDAGNGLSLNITGNLTLEAWIYPTDAGRGLIMGKVNGVGTYNASYWLELEATTKYVWFAVEETASPYV